VFHFEQTAKRLLDNLLRTEGSALSSGPISLPQWPFCSMAQPTRLRHFNWGVIRSGIVSPQFTILDTLVV
jgi:hypothetical protein